MGVDRNLKVLTTDKQGFINIEYPMGSGQYWKFVFRPFFDLLTGEELIKQRKLPDGRIKYYIRTKL